MIDDLKDRLDLWFRAHLQGIRSTVIVFGVVVACVVLSALVARCMNPSIPLPDAPPTITQAAPITHIPSRTISPTGTKVPPTETETKEATWTSESTATDTTTPTQTAAPLTATLTQTATTTPPMETIPAGRNVLTLTPHPLPRTGASQQEIADMTATATATVTPKPTWSLPAFECGIGGSIESLEWRDNVYTVTLKCPNLRWKGQRIQD